MEQRDRLKTCIVWFRRDLRCYDNPALVAALNSAERVVPLFIWAPEEEGQFQPGRQTRWWCKHSVMCLAQRLEQLGSRLIVRRARDSLSGLRDAVRDAGADGVFFNHLYDSISMVRDQQVKDELRAAGVAVSSFNADLLYEPWEVLDETKAPFTTFKSYWDRCLAMPYAPPLPLPEPSGPLPAVDGAADGSAADGRLASLPVRAVDWFMSPEQEASTEALAHRWDPSGAAAVARLEAFLDKGLPAFAHDRAKTDRESTTMLSPWIHFGSLSVRHVYYRVAQKHAEWCASGADRGRSCLDFLQQMGYREYSRYLAFHFPFITERSMLAHLRAVPWRLDQAAFKAWRRGLTGYPLVDAGMRQLWAMGWCHNRVRVVASHFMVKHLLLPWQWGLKHLWDCQIDADLECDALGWQYVSGCLSDAHPFSYLVDLEEEWKRFDPDGAYVRRWLPVLAQLPAQYAHQPWKAPREVLEAAGVELGGNYPWPIVTPDAARKGVALASAVIERCCGGGAASSDGGGGGSSGTAVGAAAPGASSGGSGSASDSALALTAGSGGGGARKEPYRPPTDPAMMSSFLAASWEGCGWQDQLPPLHITAATGHPLSLTHSAQARPLWGPALRPEQRAGAKRTALGAYAGAFEHNGRRYGLARGAMGQQQLLPAPAVSGSGSVSFLSEEEEDGEDATPLGSGAASGAHPLAEASKAAAAAGGGDGSSAMDEDDDVSSSCVGGAGGAGRAAAAKKLALRDGCGGSSGSGDDDAQVVPSSSAGGAAAGGSARVAQATAAAAPPAGAAGGAAYRRAADYYAAAAADSSDDEDDDDDDDDEDMAYGGGGFGGEQQEDCGPEYSLGTACSHLSRPAAPSLQQQKQAAAAAAEGAARLQQLQVAERGYGAGAP